MLFHACAGARNCSRSRNVFSRIRSAHALLRYYLINTKSYTTASAVTNAIAGIVPYSHAGAAARRSDEALHLFEQPLGREGLLQDRHALPDLLARDQRGQPRHEDDGDSGKLGSFA